MHCEPAAGFTGPNTLSGQRAVACFKPAEGKAAGQSIETNSNQQKRGNQQTRFDLPSFSLFPVCFAHPLRTGGRSGRSVSQSLRISVSVPDRLPFPPARAFLVGLEWIRHGKVLRFSSEIEP